MFMMSCELLIRHLAESMHLFIISSLLDSMCFYIRHDVRYMVDAQ